MFDTYNIEIGNITDVWCDNYNIEIGNVTDVWYLQYRDRKCKLTVTQRTMSFLTNCHVNKITFLTVTQST